MSSFLSQYGLRIRTKEFETVSWDEFRALLAGLSPETALGRIVAIRSETDKNVIKHFSKEQMRIYNEWRDSSAKKITAENYMVDIGISIPGFLLPIVKQLKTTVEHMGTVEDSGNPEQRE